MSFSPITGAAANSPSSVARPIQAAPKGVRYRRNGQLQSCEPCRKSKLRCDHSFPVCSRCVKRRRVDDCIYHPQPMTQSRANRVQDDLVSVQVTERDGTFSAGNVEDTTNAGHAPSPITPLSNEAEVTVEGVSRSDHVLKQDFMGPNSYSDIFAEALDSLGGQTDGQPSSCAVGILSMSAARLGEGCRALEFLADRRHIDDFVKQWMAIDGIALVYPRPAMRIWLEDLWSTHGDILSGRLVGPKRTLCETMWRNTQYPMLTTEDTTFEEWSRCATGKGIRWEVIGLIAVTYAFYIIGPHATHFNLQQHGVVQSTVVNHLLRASETCVSFCREADARGDLFVWLLYEHWRLVRAAAGNRSFRTYSALGEAVSAAISAGMHEKHSRSGTVTKTPLFLIETRRRTLLSIYAHEVSMALFLGRPPRMSSNYCDLESPLELTDDELALPAAALANIASDLEQGGKPSKRSQYIRRLKAWTSIGPRREQILGLALGHHPSDVILERAAVIEQRMQEDGLAMSPSSHAAARGRHNLRQLSLVDALLATLLQIDLMTNELVLQRIVFQRAAGAAPAKLVKAAGEILGQIRQLAQSHQIAHTAHTDYIYLLISGLSSAATLAVELLKQEQSESPPLEPLLPRSRTVQDLAEYVAALKTIDPANAAYSMCEESHQAISQILDKVLSHRPGESKPRNTVSDVRDTIEGQAIAQDPSDVLGAGGNGSPDYADYHDIEDTFLMPMAEDPADWLTYLNAGAAES